MITESHLRQQLKTMYEQQLIREALSEYLTKCVQNNHHCAHCYLNHNGICFFAAKCFENDQKYYKEDKE